MATRRGRRAGGGRAADKAQPAAPRRTDARQQALRRGHQLHDKLAAADAVKASSKGTGDDIEVEIPALDDISVSVRAPPRPGKSEVEARKAELCRAYAPRAPREPGEPVALGDEILVDAVGYAHGELFSSQMDTWLLVEENPLLPGLFEELAGTRTGSHTVVPLVLPGDYPVAALAGANAAFAVDVKAANKVTGKVDPAVLFAELGYGESEEQIDAAILAELEEALAQELVSEARARVLEVLCERAPGQVPEARIEAELQKRFRADQGEHLSRAGVAIEDQNAAFEAYTADPERRAEVRRRLWENKFLDALADHLQIDEARSDLLKLLGKLGKEAGLTATTVHSALKKDQKSESDLAGNLRRARALEKVLERAEVRFVPSEP